MDSSPTEDELKDLEGTISTNAWSIDRLQRLLARLEGENEDLMDMIDRITRPPLSCLIPSALQKLRDMLEDLTPDPPVLLGVIKLIINILTDPIIAQIELQYWYLRRYIPALTRAYNRKSKRWNKAVNMIEKEVKKKIMDENYAIAMEDPETRELIEKIRALKKKKDTVRRFKAYYKIEFKKISSKKCPRDYDQVALKARAAAIARLQAEGYDTSMFEEPLDSDANSDDIDWSGVED